MNNELKILVDEAKSKFLIVKKFSPLRDGTTGIVSPYLKTDDDSYDSSIHFPVNRALRIYQFFKLVPYFTKVTINNDKIWVDLVNRVPISIFANSFEGIIHFDIQNNKKENIIFLKKRLLLEKIADISGNGRISPTKYVFDGLKVFPAVLKKGFLVSIADKNEMLLYFTCNRYLVGEGIKSQLLNVTRLINPLWNLFDVRDDQVWVKDDHLALPDEDRYYLVKIHHKNRQTSVSLTHREV